MEDKTIIKMFREGIIDIDDVRCMYDVAEHCKANPLDNEDIDEILEMDFNKYFDEFVCYLTEEIIIDIIGTERLNKWKGLYN